MFGYPGVLSIYRYASLDALLASLQEQVIALAAAQLAAQGVLPPPPPRLLTAPGVGQSPAAIVPAPPIYAPYIEPRPRFPQTDPAIYAGEPVRAHTSIHSGRVPPPRLLGTALGQRPHAQLAVLAHLLAQAQAQS